MEPTASGSRGPDDEKRWKPSQTIPLDLAPERELTATLRDPKARRDLPSAKAAFRTALPNRFAERWLDVYAPQGLTNRALDELDPAPTGWSD